MTRQLTGQRGARNPPPTAPPPAAGPPPIPAQSFPAGWDEERYLRENADVRQAIELAQLSGLFSGYDHYVRYGLLEGRSPELTATLLAGAPSAAMDRTAAYQHWNLPAWALDEVVQQSSFEASLDPAACSEPIVWDQFNKDPWGKALRALCSNLRHTEYDILYFLPWLKCGGADLASLLHIQAASAASLKVAVALTEDTDSLWLHRLPANVDVLQFGNALPTVPLEFQALCCYLLIVALSARKVHVINSHAAWTLVTERARAVSRVCELYVSLYCYDYTTGGEPVGYARNVRHCGAHLTRIFTDNSPFTSHLTEDIGIDPAKVVTLRRPISLAAELPKPVLHSRRILWAGRLDPQKRPQLLIQIAKRLPTLRFDVHGTAVTSDGGAIIEQLQACPNITYHGRFDDAGEIFTGQHRLFLYTSAWDGLPNMLLEAMSAGMLVVTAAVGGIEADLGITNCILVRDHSDPDAYVRAIAAVYSDPAQAETIRQAGANHVRSLYTKERFIQQLRAAGYLPAPPHAAQKLNSKPAGYASVSRLPADLLPAISTTSRRKDQSTIALPTAQVAATEQRR